MPSRSRLLGLLLLLALAPVAAAQTYTIKLKYDPDPGKSVTVTDKSKSNGGFKLLDTEGNVLEDEKPSVEELVYTETTLVGGDKQREKFKRVYEKVLETKGDDKAKAKSHQGRTLVYEWQKDKYRLGVVGKPALESKDYESLLNKANSSNLERVLFKQLSSGKPLKVGEGWNLDVKELAAAEKDITIDPAKSTAEARLVKTYTKDKVQYGVVAVRTKLSLTKAFEFIVFDPPLEMVTDVTIEGPIDGSSTALTIKGNTTSKGKGKLYQDKEVKWTVEVNGVDEGTTERTAEKADPKGTEVPVADFPGDKLSWEKFTSKEAKFSAEFPGKPSVETKKDKDGNTTTTALVSMEKDTIAYTVMVTDFAIDLSKVEPKTILEGSLKAVGKTAKSNKEIEMNGFPGLEITHETTQGKTVSHMMHRVYLVNNRMYQLFAIAPKDQKDKLEVEKFFKSFKFDERKDQ